MNAPMSKPTSEDTTSVVIDKPPPCAVPDGGAPARPDPFRKTLMDEIECMTSYILSEGISIPAALADQLDGFERQTTISAPDLIKLHTAVSRLCSGKPRVICAMQHAREQTGAYYILGPTPAVRGITLASFFFTFMLFAVSLSGTINTDTINRSIYELSGYTLAMKLLLVTSAAGLGASFAVLFDVWDDLLAKRFDPLLESANWMRLGLGIVAGLVLSELVRPSSTIPDTDASALPVLTDPLLALVGGFSATVLHLILTGIVEAFRRAFSFGDAEVKPALPAVIGHDALPGAVAPVVMPAEPSFATEMAPVQSAAAAPADAGVTPAPADPSTGSTGKG